MTPWNKFIVEYAKRNNICYGCAMVSKEAQDEYQGIITPITNVKKSLINRATDRELDLIEHKPRTETKKERAERIMAEQFGFAPEETKQEKNARIRREQFGF